MSGEETTENTEQPTTSAPTPSEDAAPKTDDPLPPHHLHQQPAPEKRGEDADRYAASVAEVAAGGGGGKKDGAPGAPAAPPAPSPAPAGPPGPPGGPPMHHQVPPNSFAPPPGMMEWRGEHQMPPGYYPPYGMPPRHHPGYPPPPHAYYGPQGGYGYPPPHMMRPPVMAPGEMVRMPPGPTPTEWAAQQQASRAPGPPQPGPSAKEGPNGNPTTPSSVSQPCPSPSASSIAEESMDGKPPGTKMQDQGPPPPQHQMMSPMPPHTPGGPPPPQTPNSAAATPATPADLPKVSGKVLSKAELLDKLVGPVTHHNPIHVMHERRVFFERLIEFCERNGDPITMVPQVSKQSIDLHRLYIGVRGKGGFQAVTKEKYWKNLCTEANPDLAESSAAGYQLRKHYQRHLLMLECMETGRNPEDEVAFADKMKRQRKREPAAGSGAAAAAAVAAAAAAQQEKPQQAPGASAPGAQAPPAAYPGNGQGPPGAAQPPPGAPPPGAFPPHMDPNYHYYQQHGMMPPHPGYHPQHMNAFSPGAAQYPGHQRPPGAPGAPPAVPPGAQPMRAPMPQHMQQHEMDEQQRQWYAQQHAHQQALAAHHHAQQQAAAAAAAQAQAQAQAPPTPAAPTPQAPAPSTTPAPVPTPAQAPTSGTNTQPATPSASNQPPTPAAAATLQVESTSQAGSRAPSTGPAPSATPDSTSRLSAGADAPSETPTPTGEAGSSTPSAAPPAVPPSTTPAPPPAAEAPAPSTSAAPGPPGPQGPPGAPPQGYPYPYPPPPGAMRPPTGFAPPPGAPYGYPPGAPPPPGAYHPSHPQHPQHAQYIAWQQQRYHQQQQAAAAAAAQGQGPPGGPPRGPYPGYPGGPPPPGSMPSQRMPPPQGAPSPAPPGGPPGGKGGAPRYGTPAAPPQNRPGGPQVPQPLAATLPLAPQPSTSNQPPSAATPGGYLASTLATPGGAPPQAPQQMVASGQQPQQHQYPQGSIEAVTTAQCHVKRRKVYARELINATPRRLVMALRSGLDAEAIWAINALNVLLYDDTNPQPSLQQMPGLINVIVEHLYATLSILFPTEFPLTEPGKPVLLEESKELVDKLIGQENNQNGSCRTMIERMPVVPRKGSDKTATFTMQSRNGLLVHFRDESLPAALRKRITREHTDKEPILDKSITSEYVRERNAVGLGGGIAERLATRLRDKILHEKTRPRPVFSKYLTDDDEENEQKPADEVQVKLEPVDSEDQELQMRGARPEELSDCKHEVELAWPRPTALSPKSHAMEDLAHRALALSNILRGFSFVPGSDALMARNEALLYILGRFLKLNVTERKISTKRPGVVLDADELKKEPQEPTADEKRAKERAVLDNVDATRTQMVETAGQLRDDAFVMLTHMSVSLNLFDLPDTIAYPIYDGLLSWAVSRVPEATDATAPIPVSPRDYSLEIMCKMVVIERNVDMFLSTGKWSRVEQFVHILSRLLTMNEETHYREFAIVILNALCIASEAVCYICAMETSSIAHLILFIDSADQNMHQVMQAHGMNALRDNPELMGTSVGMLRRAASMLRLLVKVPKAYRIFMKHQTRLLQFTMSQLMDSRVAGMVADTLFEIQEYVKEFGEEVPEPLKITYSEGYRPEEEEAQKEVVEEEQKPDEETSNSSRPSTSSASPKDNGLVDDEEDVATSSATVPPPPEDDQNEEEKKGTAVDEGESCDGYESSSSLRISSQKRTATAELIYEQSRSPPPAKRTCLTNGFDKSKSSVSANGSLSEASQNDGALTTAVA